MQHDRPLVTALLLAVALPTPAGHAHVEQALAPVTPRFSEKLELLHPRREVENSTAGPRPPTIATETMRLHPLGELDTDQLARLTSFRRASYRSSACASFPQNPQALGPLPAPHPGDDYDKKIDLDRQSDADLGRRSHASGAPASAPFDGARQRVEAAAHVDGLDRDKHACVLRPMPNTRSGRSRTVIPEQAEHPFRAKPNAHSGHAEHPERACS
jgi:hypothetical protein